MAVTHIGHYLPLATTPYCTPDLRARGALGVHVVEQIGKGIRFLSKETKKVANRLTLSSCAHACEELFYLFTADKHRTIIRR